MVQAEVVEFQIPAPPVMSVALEDGVLGECWKISVALDLEDGVLGECLLR